MFPRHQEATACERGASAAEYALIVALIAVVIIGSVAAFGGAVAGLFNLAWPVP